LEVIAPRVERDVPLRRAKQFECHFTAFSLDFKKSCQTPCISGFSISNEGKVSHVVKFEADKMNKVLNIYFVRCTKT